MTSPLTGATLAAQRAMDRWKKYYLAISQPNTIFTARINQTFPNLDGVVQITYDGGTGTFSDVKPGMSCWIGSSAGSFDIGIVRVRKALTSTIVYIGRVSDIAFADNLYLTFVDDFQIWSREPLVTDTLTLMDQDIAFGAVSSFAPIVKIGPDAIVLEMTGASVTRVFTAPTIYSPIGATAAAYLWTFPGASATANLTTSTPSATYNAAGEYYYSCRVTDNNGVATTVYRKVFVNPSGVEISAPEITGDIDSGGWSCRIEGYSGVDIDSLRDRSLCVLWKQDYVGTSRDTSYGPYSGAENIQLIGWLEHESISIHPVFGTASFTIHGPAVWMDKISGAPMNVSDTSDVAHNWNEMADLNTDKALYRLIHWQSTLSTITDVTLTGNETPIKFANVNSASLRQQINGLARDKLQARLQFDRFGCARIYIPQSLKDSAGKSALTVLWDCVPSDWIERLNIERETVRTTSMVELGGTVWDGSNEVQIFSRAPGNIPNRYGVPQAPYSTLAVESQAEMNRLAGDTLAMQNIEYSPVDITLYWSNDFIDLAEYIVRLSVAASDTPRGIVWTNKRLVPQAISFKFNVETGAESTLITLAEETTGTDGVSYFPPQPSSVDEWNPPGFNIPLSSFPPLLPYANTWFPDVIPEPPPEGACGDDALPNAFSLSFDKSEITGIDDVLSAFAYFPCKIRAGTADNPTVLELSIEYGGDALGKIHCYAIDAAKNRLLTGTVTPPGEGGNWYTTTHVSFSPAGETDVAGFEIELDAGGDPGSGEAGAVITSGSVLATNSTGVNIASGLVTGKWYAVDGTGGPWKPGAAFPNNWFNFELDNLTNIGSANGTFVNIVPSNWLSERISNLYGRIYFLTTGGSINFRVADDIFGDNTGSLGYILREAIVKGARIVYLSGSGVYNVCAAD